MEEKYDEMGWSWKQRPTAWTRQRSNVTLVENVMALTAPAARRGGGNDVPPHPTSRRIHYDIPLPAGVDKGKVSQPTFLDMVARMKYDI